MDDYCTYDRGPQIGGAWYANTYPGCAVDRHPRLLLHSRLSSQDYLLPSLSPTGRDSGQP
ncbi:hypothetical protein V3481_002118 [Fusarium oxysporum f. sp. vasinfectum]